uniref:ATP-dependent DNA helicase n=1 Tax=Amphimedon queenslandica TaxID=400682 RepID=A0A1X7UXR9_AMPQE
MQEIKPVSLKNFLITHKEVDEPQLLCEIMEAVADIADMHIYIPNLTLEQIEEMLNVDQKKIFDKIKSHLINQKESEDLLENESSRLLRLDDIKTLRMFISGLGGTGKSFIIEAIKCLVGIQKVVKVCVVEAPTGVAAFNVGVISIPRLFQLPIEHDGKTAGY